MIKGFSRLSKAEKIEYLINHSIETKSAEVLSELSHCNEEVNLLIEGFSENVLSNYLFPYSVAPNFLIDQEEYIVPMVTEESSVVAAAAKSAAYWYSRGGFKTEIIGTLKNGQVHLIFNGDKSSLFQQFEKWKPLLYKSVKHIDAKMQKRGGGIKEIKLLDKTEGLDNYYQIHVSFDTCNAMGANYMNSCLEGIGDKFKELVKNTPGLNSGFFEVVMAILSNYSPENAVKVYVECPINQLEEPKKSMHPADFARKFKEAVDIALIDVSRAVTHNKGLYNGVDAVALATGNDWRAIEANGHAYAAKDGSYRSLSKADLSDGFFRFEATIPLQVGTVGGTTGLHPLAKLSMKILKDPSATELMKIIGAAGLAQNFGAVKSLVTTGIQKGHMKMHLSNILATYYASKEEVKKALMYFSDKTISHSAVASFISQIRQEKA